MHQAPKILFYEERSVSKCVETTFDFMRSCRRLWLVTSLVLFAPVSLVLGFSLYTNGEYNFDMENWFSGVLFKWGDAWSYVFLFVFFLGVWMCFVHVYSLLLAYEDHGPAVDSLSQRSMFPYYKRVALRSWWMAVLFGLALYYFFVRKSSFEIFSVPMFFIFIVMAFLVPLPPLVIFERQSLSDALTKTMRLGFSAWFTSLFTLLLTTFFGSLIITSIEFPLLLLSGITVTLFQGVEWLDSHSWLAQIPVCLLSTFVYFGFFVLLSMVLMAGAYQFGSVSERVDEASLDNDIDHFEQL